MGMGFELQTKKGVPFMPEFLNKFVGCINKKTWRKYPPGTVLLIGAYYPKGFPVIFSFEVRYQGWKFAGGQPLVMKDFSTLPAVEIVPEDIEEKT